MRDGDFEEAEIWDYYLNKSKDYHHHYPTSNLTSVPSKLPTAAISIMIPRKEENSSSENSIDESKPMRLQSSAPVNIPDVSKPKLYDKNSKTSQPNYDIEEYSNEEGKLLPPHELIANRVARTQISSFSVFEGVGRTLKGRDLSKVRNAVLTKTGFLEF
ncbi:hypothetical protein ACFE04_005105 [Oxalis oulophora]